MPDPKTYQPLVNRKNDFKLVPTSRGTEKQIHALQVRHSGVPLDQRRHLCQVEAWDPQQVIPELTQEVRVSISALAGLLKRTKDDDALLRQELTKLVKDHGKEHDEVPFVSADEYWMELAGLLLKGFDDFCAGHEISADELNFKEIQRAYTDFFS